MVPTHPSTEQIMKGGITPSYLRIGLLYLLSCNHYSIDTKLFSFCPVILGSSTDMMRFIIYLIQLKGII